MGERGQMGPQSAISDDMVNRVRVQSALTQFEKPLIRYVQMIVGNVETAKDIVADAFLKLCQQTKPMDAGHIKSWLYRVCRNGAIDFCRKENAMTTTSKTAVSQCIGGREISPVDRLEQSEQMEQVMQRVSDLSDNQQEVLRLKFQSGFSYQEIADVMGLTKSNVGVLLHAALSRLRSQLRVN